MQTMTLERPLEADTSVVKRRSNRRPVSLRGQVTARLYGAEARELVARSLTQLVEDAFLVGACLPTRHLRDAFDEPIAAATEAAVGTLVDELADLLDLMPESAADAWQRARIEADLGYE
jgi:hypothetical protein